MDEFTDIEYPTTSSINAISYDQDIYNLIATNQIDEALNFNKISIREYGAKRLSEALTLNNTLIFLNIQHTGIGSNGVKYVTESLKYNNSLKYLCLNLNHIGHMEARYIAEMLKINKSLKSLELRHNNIGYMGSTGFKYIMEALKVNSTLQFLDLRFNYIKLTDGKELIDILKNNTTLIFLSLYRNNVSTTILGDIQYYINRNIRIKKEVPEENINLVGWMYKSPKVPYDVVNQYKDFLKENKPTIEDKPDHPLSQVYIKRALIYATAVIIMDIQKVLNPFILDIESHNSVESLTDFFKTFESKYNQEVFRILDDNDPNKVYRIIKYILDDIYNSLPYYNYDIQKYISKNYISVYSKYTYTPCYSSNINIFNI